LTPLSDALRGELDEHIERVRGRNEYDREQNLPGVELLDDFAVKLPTAGISWP
jgi:hypothetical protein